MEVRDSSGASSHTHPSALSARSPTPDVPFSLSLSYSLSLFAPRTTTRHAPRAAQMLTDPTAGLGFLSDIDGLFIQQKLELFEAVTGCDTKNRYHITPIPRNSIPDPVPPEWIKHFREQAAKTPLLKAKEESDCLERVCCPMFRAFNMDFQDGQGTTFFAIHRPFKCSFNTPCCNLCPQELTLYDANSQRVAHAREEFKCCWWFTRSFVTETDRTQYHIQAPECSSSRGCNVCAPSCFNESYDMDVYDAHEDKIVSHAANVWPGCNCGGITERSNLLLRFPADATPQQRAALVAALMLVEFAHFEWKKGDNNGGGGGVGM